MTLLRAIPSAEQAIAETGILEEEMAEKSEEFNNMGAEIYAKA
jgi:hypothetical protein